MQTYLKAFHLENSYIMFMGLSVSGPTTLSTWCKLYVSVTLVVDFCRCESTRSGFLQKDELRTFLFDFSWLLHGWVSSTAFGIPFHLWFFDSIIEALFSSSFANDYFRRISSSFQDHFKIYLLWFLHEKNCSFYTYLFWCTEMRSQIIHQMVRYKNL